MLRFLTEKNLEILNPKKNGIKSLLIFLLAILIMGSGYSFIPRNSNQSNIEDDRQQKPSQSTFSPISPHMIVYGTWSENSSNIKAYDLTSGKTYILARLPSNIKKVSILSSNQLIYIANTNDKDHGTEVALYNLSTKQSQPLFKANQDFGIDDYVLSQNKRFIVDWEVSFMNDSNALRGGRSQVYSIDLSTPSVKNLIYDEIANAPVHYPLAVTDTGEIYLDTFLPNSGAGWAYGMSISNLNGSSKEDLANMKNGTYGTQPTLSPDGKYLVFAGYEGADGKEIVNGVRKAVVNLNTVELLDTQTKARLQISNVSSKYSEISWDGESGNLIFQNFEKTPQFYSYNILLRNLNKLPIADSSYRFISTLSDEKILFGELNKSLSTVGNLGNKYSFSLSKIFVSEQNNPQANLLNLSDNLIQVISVTPSVFFGSTMKYFEVEDNKTADKKTLQLETFTVKSALAKKRLEMQSAYLEYDEPCDEACRDDYVSRIPVCDETCMDSPLYLYGSAGQKVKVTIGTPVFSSSPLYNNEYDITLLDGGKMQISGGVFERITYDYATAKKIVEPNYGTIASRQNLADVLWTYAFNLGLNAKETKDLIEGTKNISSPYVFVSFFDNKTSKEILPIEFTPKPDVYINIVFYLKGLNQVPSQLPKEPVFEPLPFRNGFTAVETSWIIR